MHGLFGTKHIIMLLISCVVIVLCTLFFKKQKLERVYKYVFYTGIVSEFIKVFYYIITNEAEYNGILPKTDLPFHLCSIQILFIVVVVYSKSEMLKRVLLSFMMPSCLVGGIAALLIATSTAREGMWIISVQYFGYHSVIIAFAIVLMLSNEIKLNIRDYVNCLKFLVVLMFFAIYINSIVYDGSSPINFMYVAGPPQEGLPYLNKDDGWLAYMCRYAFLVVFSVTICYISPIVEAIKTKNKNKKLHRADNS